MVLTSVVVPFVRSRRNTFSRGGNGVRNGVLLVVRARLFAVLVKRMKRPSELRMGATESPPPLAGGTMAVSATETSCKGLASATLGAYSGTKTNAVCQHVLIRVHIGSWGLRKLGICFSVNSRLLRSNEYRL
jgi:hypothetical protein